MHKKPNPIEVTRKATELSVSLGLGAHRHALERAEEAAKNGDADREAFWKAVAAELSSHRSIKRPVR